MLMDLPNTEEFFYLGTPYAIRNDCQVGQWKVGDSKLLGKEIRIFIVAARKFYGVLGQAKPQEWLQLIFFASNLEEKLPRNTPCVTYIKTRSKAMFTNRLIEIAATAGSDKRMVFVASFEKHTGASGTYYSVTFDQEEVEEKSEEEYHDKIVNFLKGFDLGTIQDGDLPGTMVEVTNANPEAIKAAKEVVIAALEGSEDR